MNETKIKEIAEWIIQKGYSNTISGNYHIGFDEVAGAFQIPVQTVIDNKKEIADEIDKSELILSETWIDEDFDCNYVCDSD